MMRTGEGGGGGGGEGGKKKKRKILTLGIVTAKYKCTVFELRKKKERKGAKERIMILTLGTVTAKYIIQNVQFLN